MSLPAIHLVAGIRRHLKRLYEGHRWFTLRDAIAQDDAPTFYHAAIEAAFDEIEPAEQDLGQVIV